MAHNAEPMDIDDESVFDNKENTYQHSNVLPRTPCTEKGYEELDVSELNMKLRYSITPAASPMSKSMSHCLDSRNNISADDSLSNTVINEYENNLTRSLNSTLNKTEMKSTKVLPLQALPTDIADNNRTSVLRSLDTATANDITITVSNDNEIDNLSFASSSSSVVHTPEATTPTKEVPKHDSGSPIMRGLKSVLSMFRSSQSPIPPGEEDPKTENPAVCSADVSLPESKLRAVASTPKSENNKERSPSRRNSPHKESIVFNEDLEKELQWNDDSTILFSTEKIPIHKLFFQDKPSKSAILNENAKHEDANSTVEYMDVSYNDLSVKDQTLNGTVNKSRVNELAESDGEFVDCETTFTQSEAESKIEEIDPSKMKSSHILTGAEKNVEEISTTNEPFTLDTTKDIINSIDACNTFVEGNADEKKGKELNFSATDIVNQLSDLINESETSATNVIENKNSVILDNSKKTTVSDVQFQSSIQPELQNQVTSPVNYAKDPTVTVTEQVSVNSDTLVHASGIVCDTIAGCLETADSKISLQPVEAHALINYEVDPQLTDNKSDMTKPTEVNDNSVEYPSPVDVPLPNDDDINEINDNIVENVICAELGDVKSASTSQNALMATPNKSIKQVEVQNNAITCPPNLLSSDAPLFNKNSVNTKNKTHETITVAFDPVQTPAIEKTDTSIEIAKNGLINETVDNSTTGVTPYVLTKIKMEDNLKNDLPSPPSVTSSDNPLRGKDDNKLIERNHLAINAVTVTDNVVEQQPNKNPDIITIENSTTIIENVIMKTIDMVSEEIKAPETSLVDTTPIDLDKPKAEQMEISFVESNNDKNSESIAMDVSMVEANIKIAGTLNQLEPCHKEIQLFEITPEIGSQIVETPDDIMNTDPKSNFPHIEPESTLSETGIKESILDSASVTVKTDIPKPSESLNENADVSADLTTTATNHHESSSSDVHLEINTASDDKEVNIANNVSDTVDDLNVTSTTATPLLDNQDSNILPASTVLDENRECDVKDNNALEDIPKGNTTSQFEEKIDEEIVLSESNSPFISMSAGEEIDVELKKEEFEKIENPFSTKSDIVQSPPLSPKIVSKGYNFNFDDMDNTNPFATKTKIRMSPPPGVSQNTSLVTDNMNKTISVVEPVKTNKDTNRRKSMPERKKPLKAKRHLNSSVDNTENLVSKTKSSKNGNLRDTPDPETRQESQEESSQPDNERDTNTYDSVTQNNGKLDVTVPSEISACEEKDSNNLEAMPLEINKCEENVQKQLEAMSSEITTREEPNHKESEGTPSVRDSVDDKTVKNATNVEHNSGSKVIEDVVTGSSSEQSTYFSAGMSSTELTDSKNVFNLPELDGFNPFATKSKIRQTPPRDLVTDNPFVTRSNIKSSPDKSLVITQKDANSTVTFDKDHNLSTESGSSKTSEEKDVTVQEVHTEDEDTLEGPFLDADDIDNGEKMAEFTDNKSDVVDFDNLNQQDNDEAAEMFIDAEAFEFLMNQNKTDEVAYSGKESLFLKFDPLFARRVTSEGVAAALSDIKRKQSTPKKASKSIPPKEVELLSFEKPVVKPSEFNKIIEPQNVIEEKSDDMNITASKPMMAVTPAVNPVVTPRKSLTPNRSNRLSMTFTSPAMAVIDRLLSLSGNSPSAGLDTTVTHVDRSQSDAGQALTQLRELLAEKEINVYNLRCETKELKDRLSTIETQMKALETESAERLKKVNELNENLAEKTKMNRNMAAVVEEYERTIASLISETEQDKIRFAEERNQLIKDRDEQTAHLSSMEVSFNDLHSKYEKSKQVIIGYKNNEEAYKKSLQEFEENLAKMHTNYELLKQHATSKLNHANQELEKINKTHEAEVLKFNAMIKRKELHITSLEESLAQKTKANEELTAICDELINKVG